MVASPPKSGRRLLRRFLLILTILTLGLALFHRPLLNRAAGILILSDPPKKADMIVALSGEATGEREAYAADLWKAGYAPRILVAGSRIAWKTNEADCMKGHLLELGIPESKILMEKKALNTREQAVNIHEIVRSLQVRSLILVTSPYHSRRAAKTFRSIMGSEIEVISAPVRQSRFRSEEWWTRPYETRCVITEYMSWIKFFLRRP